MKLLVFTLLAVGCAYAIPAPLLMGGDPGVPPIGTYVIGGDAGVAPIGTYVIGGGPVSTPVGTYEITIDHSQDLGVVQPDQDNISGTVGNLATVVKEPLAWAGGTVGGLANGAVQGVTGGLKGLQEGGIGGLLRGLTGGVAKGTAKGFANTLGSVMKG